MATVALSGNDTISINGRILTDLADATVVELTFPNETAGLKTGKNGNTIYGLNQTGTNCEVKIRLVRGADDDKFMNALLNLQTSSFAATVLLIGEFVKKLGNGQGAIASDTYVMTGGLFVKNVEGKSNVDGDTEQSVSTYTMRFSQAVRQIT